MKTKYKGFTLEAKREKSLGGDELLYYNILRESDGWFLEDNFTSGEESPKDYMPYLQGMVDSYLSDPLSYHFDYGMEVECVVGDLLYSFTPEQIGKLFEAFAVRMKESRNV